jgi:NAD(P)-dependent dehydrogenase (short-subunit alcohol dehydrogenase family)
MFDNRELVDSFLREQPIQKEGAPDDIGRAIRFLAGPESAWITGQCLTVDGGHTIRKFPWMEDVARSVAGEALFDAVAKGELP